MFKFGTIFCAILLAFSVQVNSKNLKPNDSINDLLDELKNVVNKTISDATDVLTQKILVLETSATAAEDYAKTSMSKIADDFKAELNTFLQVAYANGVDATECLGNSEEELNKTSNITFNGLVNNAASLVREGATYASTTLYDIQSTTDEVTEIEKAIEDCGNDDDCLDALSNRIQRDIESIPNAAAEEVNTTQESIESIRSRIAHIAVIVLNQCVMETNQLTIAVLQCINNKLSGN